MSVNSLPGKWAEEDAVCTKLLALEELLWVGRDHLQLLGMRRLERCLKMEQAETGLQKPNYPPTSI